jgi:hypothetical protein
MGLVPVATLMGLPSIVGAYTQDEVQIALNRASDAVESYCEREFALVTDDVIAVDPYFGHVKAMPSIPPMTAYGSYPGYGVSFSALGSPYIGQALLPNPPVSDISQIQAWLPMVSGGSMGWVTLTNYAFAEDGLVWDTSGMPGVAMSDGGPVPSWPRMPRSLQITYTHGFVLPGDSGTGPSLPDGVVSAVIGLTSFYLDNPSGAIESRVGEITNKYSEGSSGAAGWLDEKLLGKYRLVHL